MPDTYPNEAWPTNAAIEALNGTADLATGLEYLALGLDPTDSPSYRVRYDRLWQRMFSALARLRAGMVVNEGLLKFGVYPLDYRLRGTEKHFAGATNQSVPDSTTRKVWIDNANALQTGTAWPTGEQDYIPLAEITTSGGIITAIADKLRLVMYPAPSGSPLPFRLGMAGTVTVGVNTADMVAPEDLVIVDAIGRVRTAPTGATMIVDVLVDNVSIWGGVQTNMLRIASATFGASATAGNFAVARGKPFTIEVEQVGSGVAGSTLSVVLNCRAVHLN